MENGGGCQDHPGNISPIRHIIKMEFQDSIKKPHTQPIEIIDQVHFKDHPNFNMPISTIVSIIFLPIEVELDLSMFW